MGKEVSPRGIRSSALPDFALQERILNAVICSQEGGVVRGEGPSPPHLIWGRAPGCRIGISLSFPRSTCPRWQGWGCCTVSGPAARPHRRCASRRHRAPIWPRSRPPMRKSRSCPCRGWDAHPHPDPAEELHWYSRHHPIPLQGNPPCITRKK